VAGGCGKMVVEYGRLCGSSSGNGSGRSGFIGLCAEANTGRGGSYGRCLRRRPAVGVQAKRTEGWWVLTVAEGARRWAIAMVMGGGAGEKTERGATGEKFIAIRRWDVRRPSKRIRRPHVAANQWRLNIDLMVHIFLVDVANADWSVFLPAFI
jgi:hypothetical protein